MALTESQRDEILIYSNRYLDVVTKWDEKSVVAYKKQVFLHFFNAWMITFIVFIVANTILSGASSVIVLPFLWLPTQYQALPIIAILVILMAIIGIAVGKNKTVKTIKNNNGEMGHKGQSWAIKTGVNMFFALFVFVLALGGMTILTLAARDPAFFTKTIMQMLLEAKALLTDPDSLIFIANAAIPFLLPFFYCIGTFAGFRKMRKGYTCPCCGRLDSLVFSSGNAFGVSKIGNYEQDVTRTERVGTRTTTKTTYWSDGTKTTDTSRTPIYGQVYDHTNIHEYGTYLVTYTVSCRGCSYLRQFNSEEEYNNVVGSYR